MFSYKEYYIFASLSINKEYIKLIISKESITFYYINKNYLNITSLIYMLNK